jgi:predicted XRE-type DNA-binding protein
MKSVSSGWSFLRDSTQLRAAIKYRMEELDISIKELATVLDIDPDRVSKYLRGIKPSLTNWQLIQVATHLQLEVDLTIRFLSPTPAS